MYIPWSPMSPFSPSSPLSPFCPMSPFWPLSPVSPVIPETNHVYIPAVKNVVKHTSALYPSLLHLPSLSSFLSFPPHFSYSSLPPSHSHFPLSKPSHLSPPFHPLSLLILLPDWPRSPGIPISPISPLSPINPWSPIMPTSPRGPGTPLSPLIPSNTAREIEEGREKSIWNIYVWWDHVVYMHGCQFQEERVVRVVVSVVMHYDRGSSEHIRKL